MERTEITRIASVLNDVYEGICEGDELAAMQLHLSQLHSIIGALQDETCDSSDKITRVLLTRLERRATQYRKIIEERLGMGN